MFRYLLLSFIVTISQSHAAISNDFYKVVDTDNGPVRGKLLKTLYDEKSYFAFRGIPYAEPPEDKLRFKPPVAKKPWKDTLDAFDFGSVCLQNVFLFGDISTVGSEDCLFLNVYTPDISTENKRAVLIFIHGGGFVEGSGNDDFYGPDFLLNEDVVVVTFNYRLGVLGFMSLGTPEYSGNMGLKDQNLALKWIKKNIESFGGDSNKITVFGHSAGSVSTHFHILSSESNSLFQRAILMSGSALNPWAYYPPGEHMLLLFMYIKSTGKTLSNDKDLIAFVQTVDAKYFLKNIDTHITLSGPRKELELIWAPVVERKLAKKPFIQMKPEDILDNKLNNKIDTMFGFTSAEFLFLIAEEAHNPELLKPFDEQFEIQLTRNKMDTQYDSENYKELAKKIRNFYLGEDVRVSNETLTEYNDLLSDVFMVYGIDQSVKAHARNSQGKTYYYRFSVETNLNIFKTMYKVEEMSGASHSDELCYLFRCHTIDERYHNIAVDSIEMKTIRAITKLWTNFAKFGKPTPNNDPITFKPIQKDLINFVDITNDGLVPALGPHNKFMNFWKDILEKHETYVDELKAKDEL